MGKSGAGKSTVANQMVGHDPMSRHKPPFGVSQQVLQSVTREVKHEVVKFMEGNIMYEMTVIDTVGLFDTEIKGQDPIFDKIEAYLKDYVNGINVILFVFKKGRLTAEERRFFFSSGVSLMKRFRLFLLLLSRDAKTIQLKRDDH